MTNKRFYVQSYSKHLKSWITLSIHYDWTTAMFAQDALARRHEGRLYRVYRGDDFADVPVVYMKEAVSS